MRDRGGKFGLECAGTVRHARGVKSYAALHVAGDAGRFATTRWHLLQGEESDDGAAAALSHLAHAYWLPIFAVVLRRGYPTEDAQDLTQDFFVEIAQGRLLQIADPKRGRFRSLLLRCLQNFLADQCRKRVAVKRGGRAEILSCGDWLDERRVQALLPHRTAESWSDDRLFDAGWAAALVNEAVRKLRVQYESNGRRRLFEVLSPHLAADRSDVSYDQLAASLGVSAAAVKRLLHRMRLQYRLRLREAVAATVENPADVEDEIRYLFSALCAAES